MIKVLGRTKYSYVEMQFYKCNCYKWKPRPFHTQSYLLSKENLFNELSAKQKKFKLKQAYYQKPDGVPVFLKAGLRDKILYNFTLILFFYSFFCAIRILRDLDDPNKLATLLFSYGNERICKLKKQF